MTGVLLNPKLFWMTTTNIENYEESTAGKESK